MNTGPPERRLALVIDPDRGSRRSNRKLLGNIGFDVVQAPNGLVGLELIQRLPETFQLVLTDLDLPGIPGAVVMETLWLFRPDLPVLCMASTAGVSALPVRCLGKPLDSDVLHAQVRAALAGEWSRWDNVASDTEDTVLRARARYAEGRNLVAAALELARRYGADNA